MDWTVILSVITTVAAALAGGIWLKGKGKIAKAGKLARETAELIGKVGTVLDDDKVTKEEVEQLKKELTDVKAAWKDLFSKEVA